MKKKGVNDHLREKQKLYEKETHSTQLGSTVNNHDNFSGEY